MNIAVTGATGFLGRYIVNHLLGEGHTCRCWFRPNSDRGGFDEDSRIDWIPGELGDREASQTLVRGTDAVVHSGVYRIGAAFRGGEGDLITFTEKNVLGTLQLIRAAQEAGARRFVYISSCAVHEVILDDRPLDGPRTTPLDALCARMLDRLTYAPGQRDMIVLLHDFRARFPDGRRARITSRLVELGEVGGDSAMSRTVGLPAAAATHMLLTGQLEATGVLRPVTADIYGPVLRELAALGIECEESTEEF